MNSCLSGDFNRGGSLVENPMQSKQISELQKSNIKIIADLDDSGRVLIKNRSEPKAILMSLSDCGSLYRKYKKPQLKDKIDILNLAKKIRKELESKVGFSEISMDLSSITKNMSNKEILERYRQVVKGIELQVDLKNIFRNQWPWSFKLPYLSENVNQKGKCNMSLVDNIEKNLSISELNRSTKEVVEKVQEIGEFLILRNNEPAAVLMSVERYQELQNSIFSFRNELINTTELISAYVAKTEDK